MTKLDKALQTLERLKNKVVTLEDEIKCYKQRIIVLELELTQKLEQENTAALLNATR